MLYTSFGVLYLGGLQSSWSMWVRGGSRLAFAVVLPYGSPPRFRVVPQDARHGCPTFRSVPEEPPGTWKETSDNGVEHCAAPPEQQQQPPHVGEREGGRATATATCLHRDWRQASVGSPPRSPGRRSHEHPSRSFPSHSTSTRRALWQSTAG